MFDIGASTLYLRDIKSFSELRKTNKLKNLIQIMNNILKHYKPVWLYPHVSLVCPKCKAL